MPSSIEYIKNYICQKAQNEKNPHQITCFNYKRIAIVSVIGFISAVMTVHVAMFCGIATSLYSCTCCIINNVRSFFNSNNELTLKEVLKNILKTIVIDLPLLLLIISINFFKDLTLFLILHIIDKPTFAYTNKFFQSTGA